MGDNVLLFILFQRLLAMVAEVVRIRDRSLKGTYPFFGTMSTGLARELGMVLLDCKCDVVIMDQISYFI